jgi:1,4-dihydroxy-6-naphthoate synthase
MLLSAESGIPCANGEPMIEATQQLSLGHSPDSDDAFMFYALATGKVGTGDISYEHVLKDIQTLNEWAKQGKLDATAISVHAYAYVADSYAILNHGASMGDREYGPVVVARETIEPHELQGKAIAVPGLLTSAYLALRLCVGDFVPIVMPFDTIMEAVAHKKADYGLLIHEGQLTHAELGLTAVLNLGTWWYEETGLQLPLGVNAIRRALPAGVKSAVSRHLRESIEYGLAHRDEALGWALQHARGMPRETADRFVGMYVNQRTLDLGPDGRASIEHFLQRAEDAALIPRLPEIDFVM